MKAGIGTRGIAGLATRLGRVLPAVAERRAADAAGDLARRITVATGAPPQIAGPPGRPLVRIADPAVLDRVRGDPQREGDGVLDRVRFDFSGGRAAAPQSEEPA